MDALTFARNKHLAKQLLRGAGLPTANFEVTNEAPAPRCQLEWPVIVKPARQDGSVGLAQESVCTSQEQLDQRVAYVLEAYGGPVLIEEYIDGREFNLALLELPDLECLPPAEISFPDVKAGQWNILTYEGKWKPGSIAYDTTPARVPAAMSLRLRQRLGVLAMQAYQLLGCRDYARVDFRVRPNGRPLILEVNPNPEVSDEAGFAHCLASAKIPFNKFVIRLVEHAMTRASREAKPTFLGYEHEEPGCKQPGSSH